tara:strand:- start:1026 stop:1220 length:195 start_codon:yes stop_codon:yes gene_type:complete
MKLKGFAIFIISFIITFLIGFNFFSSENLVCCEEELYGTVTIVDSEVEILEYESELEYINSIKD